MTIYKILRKLLILCLASFFAYGSSAQIMMNVQLPPVGLQMKSQLWNVLLVSGSHEHFSFELDVTFSDANTNQPIFQAKSAPFRLPRGNTHMQLSNFSPIQYNIINSAYSITNDPDGFLPPGHFIVCYTLLRLKENAIEQVAEECENIDVEAMSRPVLVLPEDQSEIDNTRPLFTWIAPATFSSSNHLNYTIRLVEVLAAQDIYTALQNNPVFTQQNIDGLSINYPASQAELEFGKTYAWQITANNNSVFYAESDVFTFTVQGRRQRMVALPPDYPHYKLRREPESGFFISGSLLPIEYRNDLHSKKVDLSIYDIENTTAKVRTYHDSTLKVNNGQNLLTIPLPTDNFIDGHLYLIELTNSEGEKWYGRFKYNQ